MPTCQAGCGSAGAASAQAAAAGHHIKVHDRRCNCIAAAQHLRVICGTELGDVDAWSNSTALPHYRPHLRPANRGHAR